MNTPTPKIVDTLTRVLGAVYAALGALMAATVLTDLHEAIPVALGVATAIVAAVQIGLRTCLLYTSPSPRDRQKSRMPSSA